ncbi:hypothetical protein VTH8203_04089 [Vibrio thalassae]|uniref:DUF2066 domain-containing protein n=1 Tax=Vibrio thalassae TaxID=1243014 RepID=A0A240EQN1_9VIBR|nr:DUF2066 domain-containing protein [Vibrio thalassae]SNX50429.1 hypothetical protein VTH8203_04089 [Vibrio thalassae]
MRYLAWLLATVFVMPAYALTKVDIYSTEVVVNSEEPNADEVARQQGMLEVLIKASGDSNAAANPVVKKALGNNSQFITQLGYTQLNGEQALRMTFNSEQINTLLKQADLSSWPIERANVMVWLVEDDGRDRAITWEHTNSEAADQLRKEAKRRGLPVTFPVGDFDDMTGIQPTDLWGGFVGPISQATQRYPVDAVMVVRAEGNNLRWTLYDQAPDTLGRNQLEPITGSASGSAAMATLIDQVSDYYAAKNATVVSGESAGTITVSFTGIKNADSFFTLERALGRLASTAKVEVAEVKGDDVIIRAYLLGSIESFEQEVLKLGLVKKVDVQPEDVIVESTESPQTLPVEDTSNVKPDPNSQTQATVTDATVVTSVDETSIAKDFEEAAGATNGLIAKPQLTFEWLY